MDIALTQQAEVEELKKKVFAQQVFLEMQQEEMEALKAAHEQQEQEREVCASPIGITALHALRTILTLGTALHLDHALSPAGPGGGASGGASATTRASSARRDATDAWVANGVRHAASGRDHATPPRIEQVALGRAHQGAPELTA